MYIFLPQAYRNKHQPNLQKKDTAQHLTCSFDFIHQIQIGITLQRSRKNIHCANSMLDYHQVKNILPLLISLADYVGTNTEFHYIQGCIKSISKNNITFTEK